MRPSPAVVRTLGVDPVGGDAGASDLAAIWPPSDTGSGATLLSGSR